MLIVDLIVIDLIVGAEIPLYIQQLRQHCPEQKVR